MNTIGFTAPTPKAVAFAGALRKGNIEYYFEVANDAYIEKIDHSKRDSSESGHFTIEQGRKCYKALLHKGFKVVTESFE